MITVSLKADVPWKVGVRVEKRKKGENVCELFSSVPFITPLRKALLFGIKNPVSSLSYLPHTLVINSIQLAKKKKKIFLCRAAHKKISAIQSDDMHKR